MKYSTVLPRGMPIDANGKEPLSFYDVSRTHGLLEGVTREGDT